jgi:hypothetical protein
MISNSPQWISLIESEASLHDETNTKHKKDDQESNVLAFVNPPDARFAPISTCFVLWHGGCSRRYGGLIMAVDHSLPQNSQVSQKLLSISRTQSATFRNRHHMSSKQSVALMQITSPRLKRQPEEHIAH